MLFTNVKARPLHILFIPIQEAYFNGICAINLYFECSQTLDTMRSYDIPRFGAALLPYGSW